MVSRRSFVTCTHYRRLWELCLGRAVWLSYMTLSEWRQYLCTLVALGSIPTVTCSNHEMWGRASHRNCSPVAAKVQLCTWTWRSHQMMLKGVFLCYVVEGMSAGLTATWSSKTRLMRTHRTKLSDTSLRVLVYHVDLIFALMLLISPSSSNRQHLSNRWLSGG